VAAQPPRADGGSVTITREMRSMDACTTLPPSCRNWLGEEEKSRGPQRRLRGSPRPISCRACSCALPQFRIFTVTAMFISIVAV
jgi:hypothetical protein